MDDTPKRKIPSNAIRKSSLKIDPYYHCIQPNSLIRLRDLPFLWGISIHQARRLVRLHKPGSIRLCDIPPRRDCPLADPIQVMPADPDIPKRRFPSHYASHSHLAKHIPKTEMDKIYDALPP